MWFYGFVVLFLLHVEIEVDDVGGGFEFALEGDIVGVV